MATGLSCKSISDMLAVSPSCRYVLPMNRWMSVLLLVAGAAGLFFAIEQIAAQDRIQRRYVATSAQIDEFSIPNLDQKNRYLFAPQVRYHFDFAGKQYIGTQLTIDIPHLDRGEADEMLRTYATGMHVTAFVDPLDPQQTVLIRSYSLAYYWMAATSAFVLVISAGRLLGIIRPARKTMQLALNADTQGYREVLCGKSIAKRRVANLLLLNCAAIIGAALSIHLVQIIPSVSSDGIVFIACLSAVVLVLVIVRLRIWRLSRAINQPRVFIQPIQIVRDSPLQIRVTVETKLSLEELHLRAELICTEIVLFFQGRRTMLQRKLAAKIPAAEQDRLHGTAGAIIEASNIISILPTAPATGRRGVSTYPYFEWILRVEITGSRRYVGIYPLEIG